MEVVPRMERFLGRGLALLVALALTVPAGAAADSIDAPLSGDVDQNPPSVYIYGNQGFQTRNQRPTVFFGATDPEATEGTGIDHFEALVDNGAPQVLAADATEFRPSFNLPDGDHAIEIRAFDPAGNQGSASLTFTVDTTPTPVAYISGGGTEILTGTEFTFYGGGYDTDVDGQIVDYAWDLDGDGTFEVDTGQEFSVAHTYAEPGLFLVSVRVTNDSGGSATATVEQPLDVRLAPAPEGEVGVSINNGDVATNDPHVTLSLNWPPFANVVVVSNDGGFGPAGSTATFPIARQLQWTLASSGPERIAKTVYVRFKGASTDEDIKPYSDDIILDQRVPDIATASLTTAQPKSPQPGRKGAYSVTLTASDDNSGVAVAEFYAKRGGKPVQTFRFTPRDTVGERKFKGDVPVSAPKPPKFVSVLDSAGNDSHLERIRNKHRNL